MTGLDFIDCVKCGEINAQDAPACGRCTWPFSHDGWSSTRHKVDRVTIDTSCINVKQKDEHLNVLELWAGEGRFTIQRSHVLIEELQGEARRNKANSLDEHPPVWTLGSSFLGIDTYLSGPDKAVPIRKILFPTTKILTSNQEYDIEHLRSHVLTGGDVFVTRDPNDFIVRGKKEGLSRLGIWVFEPQGLVEFLVELYGWDQKDG